MRGTKFQGVIATLDTGTRLNWIDTSIVERLGLQSTGGVELEFIALNGQTFRSSETLDITWAIDGASTTSVNNFRVIPNAPFDVLFGYNYLEKHGDKFQVTSSQASVLAQNKIMVRIAKLQLSRQLY